MRRLRVRATTTASPLTGEEVGAGAALAPKGLSLPEVDGEILLLGCG